MRAVWYQETGPAPRVLQFGEMEDPRPGPGEVRVRLRASGINPSDVKTRAGLRSPIAFPRVIPHSDGAGEIDAVGEGVAAARIGTRVWVWNAAWRRPYGTCAERICASWISPYMVSVSTPPAMENQTFERPGDLPST